MEGLHPADRSRVRISNSQERPLAATDLASERGSRAGSYLCVFCSVRALENSGADLHESGSWQRTSPIAGGIVGHPLNGRCAANSIRAGDSYSMHFKTD